MPHLAGMSRLWIPRHVGKVLVGLGVSYCIFIRGWPIKFCPNYHERNSLCEEKGHNLFVISDLKVYRVNEKCSAKHAEDECTPEREGGGKKGFSEAWFPSYSLLTNEENVRSAPCHLQHSVSHIWIVIVWFTGKFQVS